MMTFMTISVDWLVALLACNAVPACSAVGRAKLDEFLGTSASPQQRHGENLLSLSAPWRIKPATAIWIRAVLRKFWDLIAGSQEQHRPAALGRRVKGCEPVLSLKK